MSSIAVVVSFLLIALLLWQLFRLHQACRRANRVDWGHGWVNLLDGLNRLFCYRYHRLNRIGMRLPKTGPAIVVANHVSGLDPLLLVASARRPLRFIIAREEYQRFGLTWLFRAIGGIPVDREKRPEQALREALRCLRNGEVVALFPHGRIHLDSDPPRRIKAGAIRLSQITGAPIFPHRISGIHGAGGVIGGVLLRSRARIRAGSAIYPEEWGRDQLQTLVQGILEGDEDQEDSVAI